MVSKSINKKKSNETIEREFLNSLPEDENSRIRCQRMIMLKSKSLTKQLTMSATLRKQQL